MLFLLTLLACPPPADKGGGPSGSDTGETAETGGFHPPDLDGDDDGSPRSRDCDDADATVRPGAQETCDGRDQDCDGIIDEEAVDAPAWHLDLDEDGFPGESTAASCEAPAGSGAEATDCEDEDDEVYPGAPELCDDDVVNDCDGEAGAAREACTRAGELGVRTLGLPLLGLSADGRLGEALSMGGDMNGDGLADLLIGGSGAEGPDGVTGGAFLLHGPLSTNHVEYEVDAALYGEEEGERVGSGLALGPDMDGDGYGELVVGAPGVTTWGAESGGAAFFYGPVGGPHPLTHGDALFVSGGPGTRLGASASLGGDLSGDGVADLALGTDERDTADEGAAFLYFGPLSGVGVPSTADAALVGTAPDDRAGAAISARGDADGDGVRDLVVGAPGAAPAGAVWLALGPLSGTLSAAEADATFLGPGPAGDAGASLGFGGDADGDGLADLLIGAPGWSAEGAGEGAAFLVLGPAGRGALALEEAEASVVGAAGDALGAAVGLEGDHDGDGLADLLLGRPRPGAEQPGEALVWYAPAAGALLPEDAPLVFTGTDPSDQLGAALSAEGDTDGDGLADLLLGSPLDDAAGERAGSAWQVFSLGY